MNDLVLQNAWRQHQAGNLAEAARLYTDVLRDEPENFDALHLSGVLQSQMGAFDAARRLLGEALKLRPDSVEALYHLGYALMRSRHYPEAIDAFGKVVALNPGIADAHVNCAVSYLELERPADALTSAEEALRIDPRHVNAHINRANALQALNRPSEALAAYASALAADPANVAAWNNRGAAFLELRRYREAMDCFGKALAIDPRFAGAALNRAKTLSETGRNVDALTAFGQALSIEPRNAHALRERGNLYLRLKRYEEAAADYAAALAADPRIKWARGHLAFCRLACCEWENLERDRTNIATGLHKGECVSPPFDALLKCPSPEDGYACARIWSQSEGPASRPLWDGARYAHDRIRLAYVSCDFHDHAVAQLMAGVFEHHDRSRFQTLAVSLGPDDKSVMRARLERAFDRFIDVRGKGDLETAGLLRQMEADIVVDLTGPTGNGRPRIFAARPAPVQVNYLGYPGTSGAPYMDYILADRIVVPEADLPFYSERVVWLPDAYMPQDDLRRIAERPVRTDVGLPERGIVFCSFNGAFKFTPEVFDVWVRLLGAVEGSVLWLPRANDAAMRNLRREASARGGDPDRIVFAPNLPSNAEHLARLPLADLFLDTLPYNAHTTASDALWAGLPILTCMGQSFPGRVAASLLTTIGLPELVTHSLPEYEAQALHLARNPAALAAIRAKLARHRETSPLFDTARFTRNLEQAFLTMWCRSQAGEPPSTFAVDAPP